MWEIYRVNSLALELVVCRFSYLRAWPEAIRSPFFTIRNLWQTWIEREKKEHFSGTIFSHIFFNAHLVCLRMLTAVGWSMGDWVRIRCQCVVRVLACNPAQRRRTFIRFKSLSDAGVALWHRVLKETYFPFAFIFPLVFIYILLHVKDLESWKGHRVFTNSSSSQKETENTDPEMPRQWSHL